MLKKSSEVEFWRWRWGKTVLVAVLLCLTWLHEPSAAAEVMINPSETYANAVLIEKEVKLLKRYYHFTANAHVAPIEAELKPRHVWEKSNLIMVKFNIFRNQHGLAYVAPASLQPQLRITTNQTWANTQRVLTEIRIIRRLLGIPGNSGKMVIVPGKRPIDVFNKLNQISHEMDIVNSHTTTPTFVYAEAMRLNEDINAILSKTNTIDTATPPAKNRNAVPKDSLATAFVLMEIIQQMEQKLGLETTDFSVFRKRENITPDDILNIVGMCLAEVQTIKAKIGLVNTITPSAEIHEAKTPAEVNQLLGYMINKLRLVKLQ